MATNVLNAPLSFHTVEYNGVQFGGSDAASVTAIIGSGNVVFRATPPMYEMKQRFRYDRANVNIIGIDNVLTVRCWVFQDNPSNLGENMIALRKLLGTPGRILRVSNLGLGMGAVGYDSSKAVVVTYSDLDNGPKPIEISLVPISDICWELTWSVQFFTSECHDVEADYDYQYWMAFNYTTTWSHDFEGITTRNISGSIKVVQKRNTQNNNRTITADRMRDKLTITVPPNFRRLSNTWNETDDKSELIFNVIDQYLPGDDLPTGMTLAKGELQFSSSGGIQNATMSQGFVTMSMVLKTSPYVARSLAGQYFIMAAICKQRQLTHYPDGTVRRSSSGQSIVVIPVNFTMSNQKFDDCRVTSASITWMVQNNFWENLNSCNLFEGFNTTLTGPPVYDSFGSQDYNAWANSMKPLWNNRGVSGIGTVLKDVDYLNYCSGVQEKTIGDTSSVPRPVLSQGLPSMTCPPLPTGADGKVLHSAGWLSYGLEIEVRRVEGNNYHKQAVFSEVGSPGDLLPGNETAPPVTVSSQDAHISERQGLPVVYVAVKFAALRYGAYPVFPLIKSYGGVDIDCELDCVGSKKTPPQLSFEVFGCKVYKVKGYDIYRLRGVPNKAKTDVGTVLSSSTPIDPSKPLEL